MANGINGQRLQLSQAYRTYAHEVSTGLTPEDVGSYLDQANLGDCQHQNKLAEEILEKNWEIQTCVQIRIAALAGTEWHIQPAAGGSQEQADEIKRILEGIPGNPDQGWLSFRDFLTSCGQALLPGFAVHEIMWGPGGGTILGFHHVPARHFTFNRSGVSDYYRPLLIRDAEGKMLPEALTPADKWAIHRLLPRGGDPARGGLIRPLGWLHSFMNLDVKDFLRALEKFGMPFILAKCQLGENKAFAKEVQQLMDVIENFGSDGGGVFSGASDVQLVQAQTTGFEIYHLAYGLFERAIAKVILGQTSTTNAENSNRSVGDVHNLVRHDLRVADCRALEATVSQQILAPLTRFKYGPAAPVPAMHFDVQPWVDVKLVAETVNTLSQAGWDVADEAELSRQTGLLLKRKPEPKPEPAGVAKGGSDDEDQA